MERPKAILFKILGVTVPDEFRDQLEAFFLKELPKYLKDKWDGGTLTTIVENMRKTSLELVAKNCPPVLPLDKDSNLVQQSIIEYSEWSLKSKSTVMSTGLNELQGNIWTEGYSNHTLKVPLFNDVPIALKRWHELRIKLYTISTGSIEGQAKYFKEASCGDLSDVFRSGGHVDTTILGQNMISSNCYKVIAGQILDSPDQARNILFVTKSNSEARAAHSAGLRVCWIDRSPNPDPIISIDTDMAASSTAIRRISSFEDIKFVGEP